MATDPFNLKRVENNGYELEVLEITSIPEYDCIEYNLDDDKELANYFKDVEKTIRNSYEYRELIKYIRVYMDMNKCSFFTGIDNRETTKIKIHIHHSPITLYEIVVTIFEKRKFYNESLDVEDVAEEAAYAHYCLLFGLIPLCETVHTLVHNSYLFIPNDKVMGQYDEFIRMYKQWIPIQVQEKLERLEQYSKIYSEAEYKQILEPHYIYLDLAGTYKLPKMEDVVKLLDDRMEYLKNNNFSMEPLTPSNFIIWNK